MSVSGQVQGFGDFDLPHGDFPVSPGSEWTHPDQQESDCGLRTEHSELLLAQESVCLSCQVDETGLGWLSGCCEDSELENPEVFGLTPFLQAQFAHLAQEEDWQKLESFLSKQMENWNNCFDLRL